MEKGSLEWRTAARKRRAAILPYLERGLSRSEAYAAHAHESRLVIDQLSPTQRAGIAAEYRDNKVLSDENEALVRAALTALHSLLSNSGLAPSQHPKSESPSRSHTETPAAKRRTTHTDTLAAERLRLRLDGLRVARKLRTEARRAR